MSPTNTAAAPYYTTPSTFPGKVNTRISQTATRLRWESSELEQRNTLPRVNCFFSSFFLFVVDLLEMIALILQLTHSQGSNWNRAVRQNWAEGTV